MHLVTVKSCGQTYYKEAQFICVPPEGVEVAKEILINPAIIEPDSDVYSKLMSNEKYFSLYQIGHSPKNEADEKYELGRFSDYNLVLYYRNLAWTKAKIKLTRREAECWIVYTQEPQFTNKYDPAGAPAIFDGKSPFFALGDEE